MGCCSSSEKKPSGAAPKKQRLEERKKLLNSGKAGSLGIALEKDMTVTKASANGLRVGDLVVMVKTTESDDDFDDNDKVDTPVRDRREFMAASGPRRDVFEGCTLPITVIRDPTKQAAFREATKSMSSKNYVKEVAKEQYGAVTVNVRVGPDTENVRKTRTNKITKIKREKNLEKMDVNLVVNIMSDPAAARRFAQAAFEKADKDGSKTLSKDEVTNVFIGLAEQIGSKVPSKGAIKDLVKYMDADSSGQVCFAEFFPVFRWKMINLVSDMLDED